MLFRSLIEGTMIERGNPEYIDEDAVEQKITEIVANQQNSTFVISSAQNIDRYCSVFNACRKAHKMLIIDVYMAFVLEMVKKLSPNLPNIGAYNVLVYNPKSQMEKIQEEEFEDFVTRINGKKAHNGIYVKPEKFVYFVRCPNEKLIEKIKSEGKMINLIYSQWKGYLEEEHKTYCTPIINRLRAQDGINFTYAHTSGHAPVEELIELAGAINPEKIVPIHTENPAKMKLEFNAAGLSNVELWDDGQEYTL